MNELQILAAIRRNREENQRELRLALDDVLDSADLLHHYAELWQLHLLNQHPKSNDLMESPEACREMALQRMAQVAIHTFHDHYLSSMAGLIRPVQWLFRKQFENHTNALFLTIDETGEAALLYHHWGLADLAKLEPENADIQGDLQRSLKQLGDQRKDRRSGRWALAPSGKTYISLVSRAEYVAKTIDESWLGTDISREDWKSITEDFVRMYRNANAIVHSSLIGRNDMNHYWTVLAANNFLMWNVLCAYRSAMLPKLSTLAKADDEILWHPMNNAYRMLTEAIPRTLKQVAGC